MPEVSSTEPQGLEELNRSLLEACEADRGHQRAGENRTVGELYEEERAELLGLPERPYECAAARPPMWIPQAGFASRPTPIQCPGSTSTGPWK